jgi:DNA-binding NarL/FixJ family response regulator
LRPIRVLVADDHRMIREAIRLALEGEADIEIVAEAATGTEVLSRARDFWPDVVLLDIRMPEMDGLEVLTRLRARHDQMRVAMLSAIDEPEVAAQALQRGAVAFLGKRIDPAALATTIRSIVAGTLEMQTFGVADSRAARSARAAGLTVRESEILRQIATGRSTRAIAAELWLSQQTVKYHLTNLYRKLGVSGRAEAVRYAFDHGLVDAASKAPTASAAPVDRSSAA